MKPYRTQLCLLILWLATALLPACASAVREDMVTVRRLTTPTAASMDPIATILPTPRPPAAPVPAAPALPEAVVIQGGNLRTEPRIADETVLAQVCPPDELVILEEFERDDIRWLRVRVQSQNSTACTANHASAGSVGWLSSRLVERRPPPVADVPLAPAPDSNAPLVGGALDLGNPPPDAPSASSPPAVQVSGTRPIQELARWRDEAGLTGITFTPDGQQLAGTFVNGTVQIWNATNGRLSQTLLVTRTNTPSTLLQTVGIPLAASAEGQYLAAGFTLKAYVDSKKVSDADEPGEVWVWSVPDSTLRTIIPVAAAALAFSPDPRILAVAGVPTSTLQAAPANQPINLLGGAVQLWELGPPANLRRTLTVSGTAQIRTLHFSPDGQQLVAVLRDGTLQGWEVASGAILPLSTVRDALHVAFDPFGRLVLVRLTGNNPRLVPAPSGADPPAQTRNIVQLQLQDVVTGETLQTLDLELDGLFRTAQFSPDGTLLLLIADGLMQIWNVQSGQLEAVLARPENSPALPDAVVFSANGERLAAAWSDGTLQVWSAAGTPAIVGFSPNVPITPIPLTPTAAPIGTGRVIEATPLRSAPRTAPATARDLLCPNDALEIIERRGDWLQVRVVGLAAACGATHAAPASEGWVSVRFVARDP